MSESKNNSAPASPLKQAIMAHRPDYLRVAWLSSVAGVLALVPSWFMFEVYGRVLNSRNLTTLAMLLLMVVVMYVVIELLDLARSRTLQRVAQQFEQGLQPRLFDAVFEANLRKLQGGSPQAFADLRVVRDFFSGPAVRALLDTPAALLCLLMLFLVSVWLGSLALVGVLIQVALATFTERRTMPLLGEASQAATKAQTYAGSTLRNAQVVESMGMMRPIYQRWEKLQRRFLAKQAEASDYAGTNATVAKVVQQAQGSILLGGAAVLLLANDLWGGAGMLVVASILGGRVLSPLAQLVTNWRTVVTVRESYGRLDALLTKVPEREPGMALPAPKGVLTVEAVSANAPGTNAPILRNISFGVRPGELVAVIGPSASGKTSLARLLIGVWPALSGKVRLDGADVHLWNKGELGPHLGYLPQAVELFDGTVAENIVRFGELDMDKVREAAQRVGILELIEALPEGFQTRIGEEGTVLSGGQRQRLGLARAVYGRPQLLVLDEPNSNLDEAGDRALIELMLTMKKLGCTVVVITHRMSLMPAIDKLLVLAEGQLKMFGPKEQVLAAMKKANEEMLQKAQAQAGAARPLLGGGAA